MNACAMVAASQAHQTPEPYEYTPTGNTSSRVDPEATALEPRSHTVPEVPIELLFPGRDLGVVIGYAEMPDA